MTRILFVCLGNICRSPMAESVMTYLIKTRGLADITVSPPQPAEKNWAILPTPAHSGSWLPTGFLWSPTVPDS